MSMGCNGKDMDYIYKCGYMNRKCGGRDWRNLIEQHMEQNAHGMHAKSTEFSA